MALKARSGNAEAEVLISHQERLLSPSAGIELRLGTPCPTLRGPGRQRNSAVVSVAHEASRGEEYRSWSRYSAEGAAPLVAGVTPQRVSSFGSVLFSTLRGLGTVSALALSSPMISRLLGTPQRVSSFGSVLFSTLRGFGTVSALALSSPKAHEEARGEYRTGSRYSAVACYPASGAHYPQTCLIY